MLSFLLRQSLFPGKQFQLLVDFEAGKGFHEDGCEEDLQSH
jgi:hypothetical protein